MNRNFIWLDKRQAKCVPMALACNRKYRCARFLVEQNGRSVGDYTLTSAYSALYCGGFLNADGYRAPPVAGTPEPHDAVKGLS